MSIMVYHHAKREKNTCRQKASFHKGIKSHKRRKFIEAALYFRAIEHEVKKSL